MLMLNLQRKTKMLKLMLDRAENETKQGEPAQTLPDLTSLWHHLLQKNEQKTNKNNQYTKT